MSNQPTQPADALQKQPGGPDIKDERGICIPYFTLARVSLWLTCYAEQVKNTHRSMHRALFLQFWFAILEESC